jgi:hypothetical protein
MTIPDGLVWAGVVILLVVSLAICVEMALRGPY